MKKLLFLLLSALAMQAKAATMTLVSDSQFWNSFPQSKWNWAAFMNHPGSYAPGAYDYQYLEMDTITHFPNGTSDGTLVDSDSMNLYPYYLDGDEAYFETHVTLTIFQNQSFTWTVRDTEGGESRTLSGSLSGKVIPRQTIVVHTFADSNLPGIVGAYGFSLKEGTAPAQLFSQEPTSTSDGTASELNSLVIGGFTGNYPVVLSFFSGNGLQDYLGEYRLQETLIAGMIPEPSITLLLLSAVIVFVNKRLRYSNP